MRPLVYLLIGFAGTAALAAPRPVVVHSAEFVPNPAFAPVGRPIFDAPMGAVEQVGEVAILEGDMELVTDDGQGGFGIVADTGVTQQSNITQRFLSKYADEFDEVIVFTTFVDNGTAGALAYEMSAQQDVLGIGQPIFNEAGPDGWGGNGALHAFVDMMYWDQYRQMDGLDITDPKSGMYSVLGQEFAHRWLSFLHFRDANGAKSDAMLGRDKAHWASTLQADASVMDGNRLIDNGDGTFTNAETFDRYSMLDMYAMGLVDASQVQPWFLVEDAVDGSGNTVNPAGRIRVGKTFRGKRLDISIGDVIAAEGQRVPSSADSPHAFRVAFVVVTRPGETAAEVTDVAHKLDVARKIWEQKFAEYTGGRGTMCTQISAPCGNPTAKVVSGTVTEIGGNKNGVVEPGEAIEVTFQVNNDGPVPAVPVAVTATSDHAMVAATTDTVDKLDPGQTAAVTFTGLVPKDAACGVPISVEATATAMAHSFHGFAEVTPGLTDLVRDDFEKDAAGFAVDAAKMDTTTQNAWQLGTPVEYDGKGGWKFQPGACHSGSAQCWFTGLEQGHRPMTDSSVGVGATSLWSPALDLTKTYKPALRFFAWYQALDFSNPQVGGVAVDDLPLVVEGSVDGGKTWIELDSLTDSLSDWQERNVDLAMLPKDAKSLIVRFTATAPDATTLVEAGLDDFQIITQTAACNPATDVTPTPPPMDAPTAKGCACDVGARPSSPLSSLALVVLFALALGWRRMGRS